MAREIIPSDVIIAIVPKWGTVFAKNSHRLKDEVQEIVYIKGGKRNGGKIKCTYIDVDEYDGEVNSTILSKPAWMWGAEMGSNSQNICIANLALKSCYNDADADPNTKRLLGQDLVRLGLERGSSAEDCVTVITGLLEKYGQGGPCSQFNLDYAYHNGFVIADPTGAWILETCGSFWAVKKITSSKHLTNGYTITTDMDKMSEGLQEKTKQLNLWDGNGEFNFSKCFSASESSGDLGDDLNLANLDGNDKYGLITEMLKTMRVQDQNLCYSVDDSHPTQSSQVSILFDSLLSLHWFTGTPDPRASVYKPFVFTPNSQISHHTVSNADDPQHLHTLYKLHSKPRSDEDTLQLLLKMEKECVIELANFLDEYGKNTVTLDELNELMKDCVETETKFYR